jgi:2-oxoglutarate ferredoxin oxidoreductase subunit gamma
MAGLGMIAKAANLLQSDELKKAMKKYIKPKYHELNEKAIDLGFSLIERSYVLKEERHDFVGRGFE